VCSHCYTAVFSPDASEAEEPHFLRNSAGRYGTASDPTVGAFFTDDRGMALYLFTEDAAPDASSCYDKCSGNWQPLQPTENMTLPAGVPGELGVIERTDGIALYYWIADKAAGDITGHNVGGVWSIASPGASLGAFAPAAHLSHQPPCTSISPQSLVRS